MEYQDVLLKQLQGQLSNGRYCDIEIFVESKQFLGHKCILAALSPLLEQHIEDAEKEYYDLSELHKSKIELSGISAIGFEVLFKYMYSGKLQINDKNSNDVTVAAMILGIQPAMNACIVFKRKSFAASSLPVNFHSRLAIEKSHAPATTLSTTVNVTTTPLQVSDIRSCAVPFTPKFESIEQPSEAVPEEEDVVGDLPQTTRPSSEQLDQMDCSNSSLLSDFGSLPGALQSFDQINNNPLALPTLLSSFGQAPCSSSTTSSFQQPLSLKLSLDKASSSQSIDTNVNLEDCYRQETDEQGATVWRCVVCDKLFRKLSYLKYVHIRLHNGVRPHVCSLCGKQFATKGNLIQHNKTHLARNGVLPFKCKYCKRAFALKGNCQKHEKTHTKPYRCDFCPRVFSIKSDCVQHHRKHHDVDAASVGLKCFKCFVEFPARFDKDYIAHRCDAPKAVK